MASGGDTPVDPDLENEPTALQATPPDMEDPAEDLPGATPKPRARVCPRCDLLYTAARDTCPLDQEPLMEELGDALLGKTIDRYLLVERLGGGRMGRVYRARHTLRDHECALKVFYGDISRYRAIADRLKSELEPMMRLRHPNIVSVENYGAIPGRAIFVAMELTPGISLAKLLRAEQTLDTDHAAQLARDIARGLAVAHRAGLVHRDLNPKNVLISASDRSAKVVDFGLSGAIAPALQGDLLDAGWPIGDARYLAPEQGLRTTVGPQSDLYALGILLFEMLSGAVPYQDQEPRRIIERKKSFSAPRLTRESALSGLVAWMLERVEEDRPSSAEAVIEELNRYLSSGDRSPAGHLVSTLAFPSNPSLPKLRAPLPERVHTRAKMKKRRSVFPPMATIVGLKQQTPPDLAEGTGVPEPPSVLPVRWTRVLAILVLAALAYFLGTLRSTTVTVPAPEPARGQPTVHPEAPAAPAEQRSKSR